MHVADPSALWCHPAGQTTQIVVSVASPAKNRPESHFSQLEDVLVAYIPAAHLMQAVAPGLGPVVSLAGHGWHDSALGLLENCPA